jgi:FtsZ-binding cell division protein ZapB
MTEEYGNIPDAFHLSQSEIDELRNKKFQLTQYAKQKLQELIEKLKAQND